MRQKIKKKLNRHCSVLGSKMFFVAGISGNAPQRNIVDGTIVHFKCFLSGEKKKSVQTNVVVYEQQSHPLICGSGAAQATLL